MDVLHNTSYIFLPFSYRSDGSFAELNRKLGENRFIKPFTNKILYMFRYVAEKFNSANADTCQCFHYVLQPEERGAFHMGKKSDWFESKPHPYSGEQFRIRFTIERVHLYLFNTSVGIVAFQLHFDNDDPYRIATSLFHLKKVSKEKFRCPGPEYSSTLLDLAQLLVGAVPELSDCEFFYYANPTMERANVFSYLEVPSQENYRKELHYLRHCYSVDYLYSDAIPDDDEVYSPSPDTFWGISPEAAVCLTCPDMGKEQFIHNVFCNNFNTQYLFMYVLLLHQRYVLYRFLTKIGVGAYNTLETLESYRAELYEFETNFVFSCVTEVPQYKQLYDRVAKAFSLKQMYEDVHEPLVSLREIRLEHSDHERQKRDDSVNKALLLLSVLSIFSALVDSFDFNNSFLSRFCSITVVHIIQYCFIALIVCIAVWSIVNLLRIRKKR